MGSLLLRLPESVEGPRQFRERVAELRFTDADGVEVLASLNVDQHLVPLELDVWKTDFSRLVHVPDNLEATRL
ncbi:MAG TPA: hypothetical protein VNL98_12705 [Gemmatimonadales bacterium]|nr:hypothetical protein [Gemmatimonadales bacterium]